MEYDLSLIFFYSSAVTFSIVLAVSLILISSSNIYPIIHRSKKESLFYDTTTKKKVPFPSIYDSPSINLSVIVPAYNEQERLPPMLDECIDFLESRSRKCSFEYEVIIVSDGSRDKTVEKALGYTEKYGSNKVRVLDLEINRGKGGAVRLGIQSARGALLLFADADGATKFADICKLEESMKELTDYDYLKNFKQVAEKPAISIGSRSHLEDEAVASRTFFRIILMYGFHFLVWLFAVKRIRDTQCGFKLFTRKAAILCFDSLHVERWAFDVELLYIAQTLQIPISEIAVNWTEIEGSKVTPVWSWLQMGFDLGLIWLRYTIGAWRIKAKVD